MFLLKLGIYLLAAIVSYWYITSMKEGYDQMTDKQSLYNLYTRTLPDEKDHTIHEFITEVMGIGWIVGVLAWIIILLGVAGAL